MKLPALAALAASLAACAVEPAKDNAFAANVSDVEVVPASETPAADPPRDLSGRWTGVEGMYLEVTAGDAQDRYRLEMQSDLDTKTVVDGRVEGDTITFRRDGETKVLRPTDGATTGLKYLDGKKDCLTVAPGEGYCRD